eukprot:6311859-Amphidinium_carterae.1
MIAGSSVRVGYGCVGLQLSQSPPGLHPSWDQKTLRRPQTTNKKEPTSAGFKHKGHSPKQKLRAEHCFTLHAFLPEKER